MFVATYGERAKTAIAFAFNADFQRVLQVEMVRRGAALFLPATIYGASAPSLEGGAGCYVWRWLTARIASVGGGLGQVQRASARR